MISTTVDAFRGKGRGRSLPILFIFLGLAACGDSPASPVSPAAPPVAVEFVLAEVDIESLGDTVQLQARVLDASGGETPGAALSWSSTSPEILESLGEGRFLSRANGTARAVVRVMGEVGELEADVEVRVQQVAVQVRLPEDLATGVPGETIHFWSLGERKSVSPQPVDARGTPLADPTRELGWSIEDPEVVGRDGEGRLVARGLGETRVHLTYESLYGSFGVEVNAALRLESCAAYSAAPSAVDGDRPPACGGLELIFTEAAGEG